jgi:hypothetical protein
MTSVIKKDPRIVINKILFFGTLIIVTIGITWLSLGDVPEPLAIWTPVILSVLYTAYTALKSYNTKLEGEFQWFWQKFGRAIVGTILKLKNGKDPPPT